MDKYRPCPSIIAIFTSDSQHPPRSKHAVYLGASGLSILLHGVISIPDATSCDKERIGLLAILITSNLY